jgi:hypothetical protein
MGGTIASTVLGIFFIPLLFVVTWKIFKRGKPDATVEDQAAPAAPTVEGHA